MGRPQCCKRALCSNPQIPPFTERHAWQPECLNLSGLRKGISKKEIFPVLVQRNKQTLENVLIYSKSQLKTSTKSGWGVWAYYLFI